MNNFQTVSTDIFTKFNDLTYYDEPHKYFWGGKELLSVTTMIHQYQEEFQEDFWAQIKADEFGLTPQEIKRAWKFINRKGTMKGSIAHDYGENLLLNKVFKYPKEKIIQEFGFDPIGPEYDITKGHIDRFVNFSRGKLIPVKTELVVYDKESLVGGMLDILFYNVKAGELQIWDWKTNKEFTMENVERQLKDDLFTLQDCDLEVYSLQLEAYKYIIEKNTNLKLGKSYVVWVSHRNKNFKVVEMKDRKIYIDKIFQNRIAEIAA